MVPCGCVSEMFPTDKIISLQDLQIDTPCLVAIIGPSNCGKSVLIKNMLLSNDVVFKNKISKIYYIYSFWQNNYNILQEQLGDKIMFIEGLTESTFKDSGMVERNESSLPAILVMDDILETILSKKNYLSIFTANLHHWNLTGLLVTQSLMINSDIYRIILRQANYYIIFENIRARTSLRCLSSQIFENSTFLPDAIKSISPYSYLVIDFRSHGVPDYLRARQNLPLPGVDMYLFINKTK